MSRKRRSFEAGHAPKFLVVVDDTPECDRAVVFAARRAVRIGAALVMLRVIEDEDRSQQWRGVAEVMRGEQLAGAEAALDRAADRALQVAAIEPQRVIREGAGAAQVLALIDEDEDISTLVLASGSGAEGPGPLISALLGRQAAALPVPVTVVPGQLTDEELDALA